jgi:hypothetical protein
LAATTQPRNHFTNHRWINNHHLGMRSVGNHPRPQTNTLSMFQKELMPLNLAQTVLDIS